MSQTLKVQSFFFGNQYASSAISFNVAMLDKTSLGMLTLSW